MNFTDNVMVFFQVKFVIGLAVWLMAVGVESNVRSNGYQNLAQAGKIKFHFMNRKFISISMSISDKVPTMPTSHVG